MSKPKTKKTKAKAAPKTAKRNEAELKTKLVGIAMELAAQDGWAAVSSADVARRARVPREEVASLLPDKHDILRHLGTMIDEEMKKGGLPEGSTRDRLFEVTMRRFDALAPYRAGVKVIVGDCVTDPTLPLALLGSFSDAMTATLETADVPATPLRKLGFSAVALAVFKSWLEDDSADLSKTMAALDRRLGQLEEAAHALSPFLGYRSDKAA